MSKANCVVVAMLLATPIAILPAAASQLHDGISAFRRHNYVAAGQLLQVPAQQGNASAQNILCFLHTFGRGVPQSYRAAAHWCKRAANQGDAEAQYMLGLMYSKGEGVPEDFIEAYKWLNLAAARATGPKREHTYQIRDAVATKMSPRQVAKAQKLAMAWRPVAEQPQAVVTIGR